MMEGGAFGGAKMGAAFDPIAFIQRPQVILRALCLLFSIIIFGCISSQGWYEDDDMKQACMYNQNSGACNYGTGIAVIAFLACFAFIAGEFFFSRMSSVKTRKHYVLADLGFSGFWTFLFFVSFCFLTNSWSNTEGVPTANDKNPVQAAIAFTFFSIFTWGALAYLAYLSPSDPPLGCPQGALAYLAYLSGALAYLAYLSPSDPPLGCPQGALAYLAYLSGALAYLAYLSPSDPPLGCPQGALAYLAYLSGALAYLAYLRFKQGTGNEFATGYDQQEGGGVPGGAGYAGYPGAMDGSADQSGYQEPPFSQPQDPAGE
ncbi:Synaptogyrin [Amphibalanus amphitrite]|uniref:Synaptogyrin n=1 Tax=Amphibalanus amphitrite TaxID=1232801 RepID=A0A6A4VS70_AMPAM|nr:Synaptogyrin [Amphibalanus amphitrite]